jgi:hypothetical protein
MKDIFSVLKCCCSIGQLQRWCNRFAMGAGLLPPSDARTVWGCTLPSLARSGGDLNVSMRKGMGTDGYGHSGSPARRCIDDARFVRARRFGRDVASRPQIQSRPGDATDVSRQAPPPTGHRHIVRGSPHPHTPALRSVDRPRARFRPTSRFDVTSLFWRFTERNALTAPLLSALSCSVLHATLTLHRLRTSRGL